METKRDIILFSLIEKFKALNRKQIQKIIYSGTSESFCRARLRKLVERKLLKRSRYHIDQTYVYYTDKLPKQLKHRLMLVDLYIALGMPEVFDVEYSVANVRADAYAEVKRDNLLYCFFIEIHRFNSPDFEKYIQLYNGKYQDYFHTFPRVIILTEKEVKLPASPIKFITIGPYLSGIDSIFK